MSPMIREARLRPQYAHLYPCIPPGTWLPATTVAERLLRFAVAMVGPGFRLPERMLDEEHFDFRGGIAPQGTGGGVGIRERARERASARWHGAPADAPRPERGESDERTRSA